jgi:hypothetical protein
VRPEKLYLPCGCESRRSKPAEAPRSRFRSWGEIPPTNKGNVERRGGRARFTLVSLISFLALFGGMGVVAYSFRTSELRAELFLTQKYNPGTCFGMPTGNPNSPVFEALLPSSWRLFMRQRHEVAVTRTSGMAFDYTIKDGGCCIINTLKGSLTISPDGQIIDLPSGRVTSSEPC